MTYLDYIVQFNRLRRQQPFTSTSADLYYHLLWTCNNLGWKNPFNEGSNIIMATLGMTDKTLTSARDKLLDAGLLAYKPGKKGTFSTYELLSIGKNNTENFRSIRGESGGETGGSQGEKAGAKRGESGGLHKSKNKSKKKEANASTVGGENSASAPAENPAPALEPWAVWLTENSPRVQRMKTPLTAKQWTSLVADYGEPLVQEVFSAMENKADLLTKYVSASLTARDWCKRRCPSGKPKPAPAPSAATRAASPVNPEAVAEKAAKTSDALAQQQAEFRARQASKLVPA